MTLDRDMMINESTIIEDTVKLMSTGVSQETIDNWNPAVESHEIEQSRRDAESQNESNEMHNFQKQLDNQTLNNKGEE